MIGSNDGKVVRRSSYTNVVWVCTLELIPAHLDSLNLLLVCLSYSERFYSRDSDFPKKQVV